MDGVNRPSPMVHGIPPAAPRDLGPGRADPVMPSPDNLRWAAGPRPLASDDLVLVASLLAPLAVTLGTVASDPILGALGVVGAVAALRAIGRGARRIGAARCYALGVVAAGLGGATSLEAVSLAGLLLAGLATGPLAAAALLRTEPSRRRPLPRPASGTGAQRLAPTGRWRGAKPGDAPRLSVASDAGATPWPLRVLDECRRLVACTQSALTGAAFPAGLAHRRSPPSATISARGRALPRRARADHRPRDRRRRPRSTTARLRRNSRLACEHSYGAAASTPGRLAAPPPRRYRDRRGGPCGSGRRPLDQVDAQRVRAPALTHGAKRRHPRPLRDRRPPRRRTGERAGAPSRPRPRWPRGSAPRPRRCALPPRGSPRRRRPRPPASSERQPPRRLNGRARHTRRPRHARTVATATARQAVNASGSGLRCLARSPSTAARITTGNASTTRRRPRGEPYSGIPPAGSTRRSTGRSSG